MKAKRRVVTKDEYSFFEILRAKGVAVAPFATAVEGIAGVGIPAVVIARHAGGLDARTMVARYGDIAPTFARVAKAKQFFMQKYVTGHEVACGVLKDGRNVLPLVPVDALPRSLHESGAWHMTPAVQDGVQAVAKAAHKALGIKGHSCVRFVVDGVTPYVTGVEVAPSLARTGLFMRSALLAGFTPDEIEESFGLLTTHYSLKTNS